MLFPRFSALNDYRAWGKVATAEVESSKVNLKVFKNFLTNVK